MEHVFSVELQLAPPPAGPHCLGTPSLRMRGSGPPLAAIAQKERTLVGVVEAARDEVLVLFNYFIIISLWYNFSEEPHWVFVFRLLPPYIFMGRKNIACCCRSLLPFRPKPKISFALCVLFFFAKLFNFKQTLSNIRQGLYKTKRFARFRVSKLFLYRLCLILDRGLFKIKQTSV